MGTWGTGLFADDSALDLRDEYRDLLGQGMNGRQAEEFLVKRERPHKMPLDERARFWMALAATEWRCGRLTTRAKSAALSAIDAGADITVWERENPGLARQRARVIEKLRIQLESPQRAATRVGKRFVHKNDYSIGDAVAYRLRSNRYAVWRVIGVYRHGLSEYAIYEMCSRIIASLAAVKEVLTLSRMRTRDFKGEMQLARKWGYAVNVERDNGQFLVRPYKMSDVPTDRLQRVASGIRVEPRDLNGTLFFWWSQFDDDLKNVFKVE